VVTKLKKNQKTSILAPSGAFFAWGHFLENMKKSLEVL
jgi:hypothetical protein